MTTLAIDRNTAVHKDEQNGAYALPTSQMVVVALFRSQRVKSTYSNDSYYLRTEAGEKLCVYNWDPR